MQISVVNNPDGVVVVSLSGRMDSEGAQAVDLKLAAQTTSEGGRFVLDISDVSFLASIGIRTGSRQQRPCATGAGGSAGRLDRPRRPGPAHRGHRRTDPDVR